MRKQPNPPPSGPRPPPPPAYAKPPGPLPPPRPTQHVDPAIELRAENNRYRAAVITFEKAMQIALADRNALRAALLVLETHHVRENGKKGRAESRSFTLRIVRAALAGSYEMQHGNGARVARDAAGKIEP